MAKKKRTFPVTIYEARRDACPSFNEILNETPEISLRVFLCTTGSFLIKQEAYLEIHNYSTGNVNFYKNTLISQLYQSRKYFYTGTPITSCF